MSLHKEVYKRFLDAQTFEALRYGFLAVYKRPGLTCAQELEELKNAVITGMPFQHKSYLKRHGHLLRAGHGGNLDSMATGVLGVAFCDGCKILPELLSSSKRYNVTAQLGTATDTYNNIGKVIAQMPFDHVTQPMIEEALTEFLGEIFQQPPAYSALKIKGQRASDIARMGGNVRMVPRPVVCHSAKLVSFEPPHFSLDISCGQGFYIRSLVHDLAHAVGTCAHVTVLERTKHGPFSLKDCLHSENYTLENIIKAVNETRERHPKLTSKLATIWHDINSEVKKESTKEQPEEEERAFESYLSFQKTKSKKEAPS